MEPIFTGIATALVTPFNHDQTIDFPTLGILIERQIEMQVDALVILGTTGEISTLSNAERLAIIDYTVKKVQNRIPIIFGIGGNDPTRIIKLGRYVSNVAKQTKQKISIMVTAPYYNKSSQDGIYQYFKTITEAIKLPTIIYNIPSRTGVNIYPETISRIVTLPYVAGIKEASGNLHQIAQIFKYCSNTTVYCGDDTLSLPSYAIGCRGIISVASNIDVEPLKKIWHSYVIGKVDIALQNFQKELPFYESLFRVVNPIPIKYELAQRGLIKNVLRLPLIPIQ